MDNIHGTHPVYVYILFKKAAFAHIQQKISPFSKMQYFILSQYLQVPSSNVFHIIP